MSSHPPVYIFRGVPDLSFIEVESGAKVVIKPNLVKESNLNDRGEWQSVITSSDLIRQVGERVCSQLGRSGELAICDAPQEDSSFGRIAHRLKLHELASYLQKHFGVPVKIL